MEAVSRGTPTLDHVARRAGVSRATASRAFSGHPRVSEEARHAVEQAAQELGYVPNRAARSLAAGRSDSVGVVLPAPTTSLFADPSFPRLLRGIGEELSRNNLQMVLFAPQSPADESRLEQYLAGGHVDSVLLFMQHESDSLHSRLQARGIPMVVGGRPNGQSDVSFVDVDNHAGGQAATQHLIAKGRRRIAHIAGPPTAPAARDRFQGFRAAMWNAGLDAELVEYGDLGRDSGEVAMERLLARDLELDAVFVASDLMAAGALWALQTLGRRVPDDVAIIGFDDSPIAKATRPTLSSVRQPIEDMGREMARLVLRISGAQSQVPQQMILGPQLSLRESTAS